MTVKSQYLKEYEIKATYREDLDLSLTDSEYSQYESDMGHYDDIKATNGVDVFL